MKAMESLYGSSSESKNKAMYDWKSGVRRKDMGVERPRAATTAFSKWTVLYELFDKGTTVAQLEEQRVAQFGDVPEISDHVKWLQETFTKQKPEYGARKVRGEKGAATKKAKTENANTALGVVGGGGGLDDDDGGLVDDDDDDDEGGGQGDMDLD